MSYVTWSNTQPNVRITTASVIPAYVAKGQALDGGITERLYKLNSVDDYLETVAGTALDMTKELDKMIYLHFRVYGLSPLIIYNVDSTSVLAADIVTGIEAVGAQSMTKLYVRPFCIAAEDSGTESTIRDALAAFALSFDGGHVARAFYLIDDTITTKAGAIADKTITAKGTSACWGTETIGSNDYSLDMIAMSTLVFNTISRANRVYRSVSKIEIPNAIAYNKDISIADVEDLENAGVMSVMGFNGTHYIKGVYTAHWTGSGTPTLVDDYQATVDQLAQTENEIREVVRAFNLRTVDEVKRITGAGIGLCQGRSCEPLIMSIIAQETNLDGHWILPQTKRPPTKPIKLEVLATNEENEI